MWSCKACTFENADLASECEVCGISKDDDKERWQCTNCCQLNTCDRPHCAVCDHPRQLDHGNVSDPGNHYHFERGAIGNGKHLTRETASSLAPAQQSRTAGDETIEVWVCQKTIDGVSCCANNKINDLKCVKCSASKPYISSLLVLSKVPVLESGLQLQDMHVSDTGPGLSEPPRVLGPSPPLDGAYATSDYGRDFLSRQDETAHYHPSEEKEEEIIEFPDAECRMVLVGKTGTGKSSTANTIVGMKNHFKVSPGFDSETKFCKRVNKRRFGIQLEVMDTPGLFDTTDQTFVAKEIAKCMAVMAPGPHAIILVLRIGIRFTEEEAKAIDKVYDLFGDQLLRFLVIVFTHGDKLTEQAEKIEFEKLLSSAPARLRQLIKDSQKRYVLFNNEADKKTKDEMVKKLLETIRNLLKVNGGRPYTSDLFNRVENKMLERERQLEYQFGVEHMAATDRKRGVGLSFREMVRVEAMEDKSFLQQIKDFLFPFLGEMFTMIKPILFQIIQQQLQKKLQDDSCSFL